MDLEGFDGIGDTLQWFCDPTAWEPTEGLTEGCGGSWTVQDGALVLAAPSKKDFWRKTYYDPILCKDDGPCLFATIPLGDTVTVETAFTLDPKRQFDQAGLCIRLDHDHWVKTGIEVVDGKPRLSCVVTNVMSDWSTQAWPHCSLRIRIHKIGSSFVVEAKPLQGEHEWAFIRIAHLSAAIKMVDGDPAYVNATCDNGPAAPEGHVWMGVFACCPEEQAGSTATFHAFSVTAGTAFEHNADGNHE